MSSASWSIVEFASHLLDHDEREAVLGDLSETGESAWRGLLGVLGLALRRQTSLWKSWKPWFAGFVVALPSSYLLVAVSASVTATFQRVILHRMPAWHSPTGNEGFLLLACHVFLLIAWSWTVGFVVGSVSRGSTWISVALCAGLVFFCAPAFMAGYLCKISLTLFFVPAIWGAVQGIRLGKIKLWAALTLAMTITGLMIAAWSNAALWIPNWLLVLPPWYLVAMTRRRGSARNDATPGLTSGSVA